MRHVHTFCRWSRVCTCGRRWEDYLSIMWKRYSGRRARWCSESHDCKSTILDELVRVL